MVAFEIAAILAFLSSTQAFKAPANMTNGVYAFGYDEYGTETYHKIADVEGPPAGSPSRMPAANLLPSRLTKRYGSSSINSAEGVNCIKDGAILDYSDVAGAAAVLGQACDGYNADGERTEPLMVPKHEGRVAVYGTAQVFMCNMGAKERSCSSWAADSQIKAVADKCSNVAGKVCLCRISHSLDVLTSRSPGWYNQGRPS